MGRGGSCTSGSLTELLQGTAALAGAGPRLRGRESRPCCGCCRRSTVRGTEPPMHTHTHTHTHHPSVTHSCSLRCPPLQLGFGRLSPFCSRGVMHIVNNTTPQQQQQQQATGHHKWFEVCLCVFGVCVCVCVCVLILGYGSPLPPPPPAPPNTLNPGGWECAEGAVTKRQWPGCLPTGTGKREGCV